MASRSAPSCTHELRPGIAVCLRCQHAERAAHLARQRKVFARGAVLTLAAVFVAAVAVAGTGALRARAGSAKAAPAPPGELPTPSPSVTSAEPEPAVDSEAPAPADRSALNDSIARLGVPTSAAPIAPVVAAPGAIVPTAIAVPATPPSGTAPVARVVAPLVPVGRTALRDTMVADRAGDTVRVSFDLALSRTRRSDKFEAIVRSTLPQVYGAQADSALRALPAGAVARAGDLVTTLSERGFRIPLADGRTIAVWPETRAGRDGPLVVAYRAVGSR
jgi:hypothetical protein